MRRAAARILALAALLAVAVVVLVIVLGRGGGGDAGGVTAAAPPSKEGGGAAGRAASAAGHHAAPPPAAGKVRNALPQPGWQPYSGPVPIFRWHEVGEPGPGEPYSELDVSAADFSAQMDWLGAHGYEAVGLEAVQRAWAGGGTLPAKPVVLSFDGVEGELLSTVLPDLSRRGWPGVLVLDAEARPGGPGGVDPAAVRRLLAAGWELEAEAAAPGGEGRRLEARFGVPVRDYAFPQGKFEEAVVPAVEAAGYEGATASGAGFAEASEPFDLPRITIFGLSGVEGFAESMRSRGEGVGA